MIPQSTINTCVKAYYGSNEDTDYGKIQAVLMAYESLTTPPTSASDAEVELPKWTLDCQGKQDMDGEIARLSTRYYPGNYRNDGRPSTIASIYCGDTAITEAEFDAATETEVKAATEAWAREQWKRVIDALTRSPAAVGGEEVDEAMVFRGADAICSEWNMHYADAVRMVKKALAAALSQQAQP